MSSPARVAVAFGTRPEATKMAPVVRALESHPSLTPWVLVTGQHREQLDAVMTAFGLRADRDLALMSARQRLPELLARIVPGVAEVLRREAPAYLLVHGDTLTTFGTALAAFYEGVPVGHVEAGLRSHDLAQPFPEEANRRLTDVLTDLDLPPTPGARDNLLAEGHREEAMVVTGNTVVDAVRGVARTAALPERVPRDRPLVTVTLHRRENLPALAGIAEAVAQTARAHPDHLFVYPVHRNPAVRDAVRPALAAAPNVWLEEPWPYADMVALMAASRLLITDSGGLQEEGASLGVPVAVVRNVTERPEGVAAGVLRLVGNDPAVLRDELPALLGDAGALAGMRDRPNPYGDGRAGARIAAAVAWRLGLGEPPPSWPGVVLGAAEPS